MTRNAVAIALTFLAAAAAPAPTAAQDNYHVRNDTGRSLTCGLRRDPRRIVDRFVLVRGTEATRPARGGRGRSLLCDSQALHTQRFRMLPGIRYALVQHEGVVSLRRLGPAQ